MEADLIETLVKLRMVVGYLGEKEQYGWWGSSFFTQGSSAFLAPLFSRTQILAQCSGVTRAAALVHDERIGVGHVYHLFRLPEDLEQSLHQALHSPKLGTALQEMTARREVALEYLRQPGEDQAKTAIGPVRMGDIESLRSRETWRRVSAYYHQAFSHGEAVFPYFTDLAA